MWLYNRMNHKLAFTMSRILKHRYPWLHQYSWLCQHCININYNITYGCRKFLTEQNDHGSHGIKSNIRRFSSTPKCMASRIKNRKDKTMEPLRLNPKPMKMRNVVSIQPNMTVKKLADTLHRPVDDVFEALLYVKGGDNYEETFSVIDNMDVIKSVVKTCGMRFEVIKSVDKDTVKEKCDIIRQQAPDESVLRKRSPVITIMGHVDHGKTTLLDYLRKSKIVDQEFGGITQHIGAFSVKLTSGETITFLDTPGHAVFSTMRARGAQVTDIVVLVVAADDGVMPQTVESIQHAISANVPIIVAVNKIDKQEADLERTKRMLMEQQLLLEEFGGDIQVVPISALKGINVQELQEAILTQSEVMELKADYHGLVEGRIIESKTDPGRGRLATIIVQRGTLKKGAVIVAGNTWAKVRGMFDDNGKPVQSAPPSTPVEIIGWKELPSAGDEILEVESEKLAREVIDKRLGDLTEKKQDTDLISIKEKRAEHKKLYDKEVILRRKLGYRRKIKKKQVKETVVTHEGPQLSLVLKGDVDGSVEAILDCLDTYNSRKCRLDIIHYGIGNITEHDVKLAESFDGVIMGFNVIAPSTVKNIARSLNVPVSVHQVIYKLFDDLHSKLNSKLPPIEEQETIGEANVLNVFNVMSRNKRISVAGCRCVKGFLNRKKTYRVLRKGEVIYDGQIESLKHHKNEVESIKLDVECGLSIPDKDFQFKSGDLIQCYDVKKVTQEVDWDPGF